jgi:GNAT superfamily N-acetyltransferase
MGAIEVRETDPADEAALRAWWEVGHAAEAERPLDLWTPWEVARRALPAPRPQARTVLLSAHEDDRVVGAGILDVSDRDNTHLAVLSPYVAPADRGRGVGSAVLAALERRAADEGRTTLISDAHVPPVGDSAGSRFAARHGYAVASQDTVKAADLAATESTWAGLAAHAAERAEGYELVWWGDRAPEEHVEGVAVLFSRFLGEIPLGDLDLEPQTFDVERIRHGEERRVGSGVTSLLVAAAAPSGELVGYSNLSVPRGAPRVAEIDSTLVLPEHRGHRLGLAMKVLLHQLLRAESPGTELLVTGNADVNQHMNAVNDALGYRPVERVLELQKVLT